MSLCIFGYSSKLQSTEAVLTSTNLRMSPFKKKAVKLEEDSLEATPKAELPACVLPNDENKLFDEDDDLGTSTIPDVSAASEEEKEMSLPGGWDHAIDTLFKLSTVHSDGRSLNQWVHYQNMASMEQIFQWDERQLAVGSFPPRT